MIAAYAFNIVLDGNGGATFGATIAFGATLMDHGNVAKNESYKFEWRDDARPPHKGVSKHINLRLQIMSR